jgi:hypothetical protein
MLQLMARRAKLCGMDWSSGESSFRFGMTDGRPALPGKSAALTRTIRWRSLATRNRRVRVQLKTLHKGQQKIYDKLGHRNVLRCGRRFGKTTLLETTFGYRACDGKRIGWFASEYKLIRPTYTTLRRNLLPLISV